MKLKGQKRLEEELERLMQVLNVHYDLTIIWVPDDERKVSGEVKGDVIYLYEKDENKTRETLKHELLDYFLTNEIIKPLVEYVNMQKSLIERLIYMRKEDLVERLSKLL